MTPDAEDYVGAVDRLLATKDYDWARDTLEGIRDTILATGRVTLRQKGAIEHIIVGRLKHDVGGA